MTYYLVTYSPSLDVEKYLVLEEKNLKDIFSELSSKHCVSLDSNVRYVNIGKLDNRLISLCKDVYYPLLVQNGIVAVYLEGAKENYTDGITDINVTHIQKILKYFSNLDTLIVSGDEYIYLIHVCSSFKYTNRRVAETKYKFLQENQIKCGLYKDGDFYVVGVDEQQSFKW